MAASRPTRPARPPRPASRPALRPARRATARHTSLTGRAAVLALVVGVLVVLLAYPLRQYLEQRARLDALQRQNEIRQESVGEMRQNVERLKDPAYVRMLARKRLHFVMPGETGFVTLPKNGDGRTGPNANEVASGLPDDEPWYGRLWSSVQVASGTAGSTGTAGSASPSREQR